jgi:hypothetical protein
MDCDIPVKYHRLNICCSVNYTANIPVARAIPFRWWVLRWKLETPLMFVLLARRSVYNCTLFVVFSFHFNEKVGIRLSVVVALLPSWRPDYQCFFNVLTTLLVFNKSFHVHLSGFNVLEKVNVSLNWNRWSGALESENWTHEYFPFWRKLELRLVIHLCCHC